MVFRTAPFSMTLKDPKPRFQGQANLWRWISPNWPCVYNFPPHLRYVSTLPDNTYKPKSYVVFLSVVWVAIKRTGFGVSAVALKSAGCMARSQYSKWRPFAFIHACSRVCHWSLVSSMMPYNIRNTVPSVNEPLLQLVIIAFRFFCVMSGSVET